jgi:hypothetical protein
METLLFNQTFPNRLKIGTPVIFEGLQFIIIDSKIMNFTHNNNYTVKSGLFEYELYNSRTNTVRKKIPEYLLKKAN